MIELLKTNRIHRVIVEDLKMNSFTGFITYENIFEYFLENYYSDKMDWFKTDISLLSINEKEIICVYKNETIIRALEILHENKISTLPVLDQESNEIYAILYLKDIIFLFNNDEKFTVIINYNNLIPTLTTAC